MKYTITMRDTESPAAWFGLCDKVSAPMNQDSERFILVVETEQEEALERALDSDRDVLRYETCGYSVSNAHASDPNERALASLRAFRSALADFQCTTVRNEKAKP